MYYLIHELRYFTDLNNKIYQFILFIQPLFTLIFVFLISNISGKEVNSQQMFYSALTSMLTYVLYSDGAIVYSEKKNGTMELLEVVPFKFINIVVTKSFCNSIISLFSFLITQTYSGIFFKKWVDIKFPIKFTFFMFLVIFSLSSFGSFCAFIFGNSKNLYSIQNAIIPPFLLISGIWNTSNDKFLVFLRSIGKLTPIGWSVELISRKIKDNYIFIYIFFIILLSLIYLALSYFLSQRMEIIMRKEGRYNEFQ